MKGGKTIRVTLLSYLFIITNGNDLRSIKERENTSHIFSYQQANNTIQMEDGDAYDCIDMDLQPAFNHPLLKDHKIQMEPSSFPARLDIKSGLQHTFSEVQPCIVPCPIGTVPILRNSRRNQIVAHNIEEVISEGTQQEMAGIRYYWDDIYGTRATISIHEPRVKKNNKDDSASWIQINRGPQVGLADGIGVGSAVSLSSSGDSFTRFYVGWQLGALNETCENHKCPGFVQVNHNVGLGGRIRPVSIYNGPQYVINVLIFKDPKTKNWWVAYGENNTPIGYWPSSLFTYLKERGHRAYWGGYVQGPTASLDSPQMGSGHFASEGYKKAAFMKNIQIVDENNKLVTPNNNKAHPGSSVLSKYTVDGYRVDNHGLHVYYGGPGDLV
uniref:Uncharacterized protein n=1 Tax=Avena sativa TaxID=4498 RepID=A0ACD5Z567_AVESA